MNRMKKIVSYVLIGILSFTMINPVYATVNKHESIYIKLHADGTMNHTTVVNRFHGSTDEGEIVDYGPYTSIKSLVDDTVGHVEDHKIIWPASVLKNDFYYEGELEEIQLPNRYRITYYLNDEVIDPSELAGKEGSFKLKVSVIENEAYKKDMDFSTQIQVTLDLDKFSDVSMSSGNVITVGKTLTVNYMLLPDQTGEFILEATVKNLELDPITMTLVPFDMTIPGDIQDGIEGLEDMEEGSDKLVEETAKLNDGMVSVKDGIHVITKGSKTLKTGVGQVREGLKKVTDGTTTMKDQSARMTDSVNQLVTGITTAQGSVSQLVGGYGQIKENMDKVLAGKEQTLAMANKMIQSGVETNIVLGNQLIAQMEAYTQMAVSMEQLNTGLNTYVTGITKVEEGLTQFNQQVSQMPDSMGQLVVGLQSLDVGTNELSKGITTLYDGANQLNQKTKDLPSHVNQLLDGQKELQDGIVTMHEKVKSYEELTDIEGSPISFIDPRNPMETRTQLIIQTPSIKVEDKKVVHQIVKAKKSLWDRVLDLFR